MLFRSSSGSKVDCALVIENTGVAPLYENLPLSMRLVGTQIFTFDTGIEPITLLPGTNVKHFTVALPKNMPSGSYSVQIGIAGISFATDAPACGDFYEVGSIHITDHGAPAREIQVWS